VPDSTSTGPAGMTDWVTFEASATAVWCQRGGISVIRGSRERRKMDSGTRDLYPKLMNWTGVEWATLNF
jgi:hypothetical protein